MTPWKQPRVDTAYNPLRAGSDPPDFVPPVDDYEICAWLDRAGAVRVYRIGRFKAYMSDVTIQVLGKLHRKVAFSIEGRNADGIDRSTDIQRSPTAGEGIGAI